MSVTRCLPLVVIAALSGCGIGTWDDTDLLFDQFKIVPDKDALKMLLPGAEVIEGNLFGLNAVCDGEGRESLTCGARGIVRVLNRTTRDVLALVDGIIAKDPSRRERGKRIWGPYFVAEQNRTFRFEMSVAGTAEAREFRYCLHAASGKHDGLFGDSNVQCGSDRGAWIEFLHGTFRPDPDAPSDERGIRKNGDGDITLEFNKLQAAALSDDEARGVITFSYRFDEDTSIVIDIKDGVDKDTGRPTNGGYTYSGEKDGSGAMTLTIFKELESCDLCFGDETLEKFSLTAQWRADKASLVEARASGGDLPMGREYYAYECVDGNNTFVARRYEWDMSAQIGNAALCAFPPASP